MSNFLKEKCALASLRAKLEGKKKESSGNVEGLDTEPNTAEKRKRKRGNQLPKINLKF